MSKRKRLTADELSLDKIEEIAEKAMHQKPKKDTQKPKKEPSKRFEIRIPKAIYDKLKMASDESGYSKTSIILRGINKELKDMAD